MTKFSTIISQILAAAATPKYALNSIVIPEIAKEVKLEQ